MIDQSPVNDQLVVRVDRETVGRTTLLSILALTTSVVVLRGAAQPQIRRNVGRAWWVRFVEELTSEQVTR